VTMFCSNITGVFVDSYVQSVPVVNGYCSLKTQHAVKALLFFFSLGSLLSNIPFSKLRILQKLKLLTEMKLTSMFQSSLVNEICKVNRKRI